MHPHVGQVINNKYRLVRLIGDGGMGSVFEARHELLGTHVALKFLHPQLAKRKGLIERFMQEAQVSARIRSPHVVQVSDVDRTSDDLAYMVMELVEGKSLQALYEELFEKNERVSYGDAFDFVLQIIDGVGAAHKLGIVHRDLKPDNVMLTKNDKGRTLIKVLDFGIAKLKASGEMERGLTRPGVVMGTPEYMAPEQAFSADQADGRADIFSIGVMFYEMLAGRRPVGGDDARGIAAQYLDGSVTQLKVLKPSLTEELTRAVHKAMAARPAERFATVEELRVAIEPFAPEGLSTFVTRTPLAPGITPQPATPANATPAAARQSPAVNETVPPEETFADEAAPAQAQQPATVREGGAAAVSAAASSALEQSAVINVEPARPSAATAAMSAVDEKQVREAGASGGIRGVDPAPAPAAQPQCGESPAAAPRPGGTMVGEAYVPSLAATPAGSGAEPSAGAAPFGMAAPAFGPGHVAAAQPAGGYAGAPMTPVAHGMRVTPQRVARDPSLLSIFLIAGALAGSATGGFYLWNRQNQDSGDDGPRRARTSEEPATSPAQTPTEGGTESTPTDLAPAPAPTEAAIPPAEALPPEALPTETAPRPTPPPATPPTSTATPHPTAAPTATGTPTAKPTAPPPFVLPTAFPTIPGLPPLFPLPGLQPPQPQPTVKPPPPPPPPPGKGGGFRLPRIGGAKKK